MSILEHIKFNDTDNYKHLVIRGFSGVYTEEHIDEKSLPEGYRRYSLWGSETGRFDAVIAGPIAEEHRTGEFITKTPLPLRVGHSMPVGGDDIQFTGMPFDMEAFFGRKESIDLQINKAEEKRNDMAGEKPERQKIRSTSHEEEQFL